MNKQRIDLLLVERGLTTSRERAQTEIMAGNVMANGQRVDKAGEKYDDDVNIEVKGDAIPYVSRGGLKLEKALKSFPINLNGKVCIDVGSSTGGFTDCMLKNGAVKVFAIDVGYGQLAWTLRNDPRVVCMERTNIRYVEPENIGEKADFASIDVSFISLTKVLPALRNLLKEDAEIVCLVKPQFEAGREKVGKKGVVRDRKVHLEVLDRIVNWTTNEKFVTLGLNFSPIKGPEGNIEYLLYLSNDANEKVESKVSDLVESVIEESYNSLKNDQITKSE